MPCLARKKVSPWQSILDLAILSFSSSLHDPSAMDMPDEVKSPRKPENAEFVPKGAIFFFVLLLLFYAALWFLIYGIMIARS